MGCVLHGRASHRRVSHACLIVYLMGVHLMGVYLIRVHLMSVSYKCDLTGVQFVDGVCDFDFQKFLNCP
jgi:hypothetical protein